MHDREPAAPTIDFSDRQPLRLRGEQPIEGATATRVLHDGTMLTLVPRLDGGVSLTIANPNPCTGEPQVGSRDQAYEFDQTHAPAAILAIATWSPEGPEPDDWCRHIPSHRRRPDSTPASEYVDRPTKEPVSGGCTAPAVIEVSYSEARVHLAELLDRVSDDRELVRIHRQRGTDAVLLDADQYTSLAEAAHLPSSPAGNHASDAPPTGDAASPTSMANDDHREQE